MVLLPRAIQHVEPFPRTRVAVVMFFERHAVLARFAGPPGRHNVQSEPSVADVIDVCRLLCQQRRQMKCRTHCNHQLDVFGYRRKCGGGGPRVKRWGFHSLNVIQIQFGDQREIETNLFTALRQPLHIRPAGLHVFVLDVAQPTAKNGKPVSVSHRRAPLATGFSSRPESCRAASWRIASSIRKSASRAYGSNPITRTGSATKFESAFTS